MTEPTKDTVIANLTDFHKWILEDGTNDWHAPHAIILANGRFVSPNNFNADVTGAEVRDLTPAEFKAATGIVYARSTHSLVAGVVLGFTRILRFPFTYDQFFHSVDMEIDARDAAELQLEL